MHNGTQEKSNGLMQKQTGEEMDAERVEEVTQITQEKKTRKPKKPSTPPPSPTDPEYDSELESEPEEEGPKSQNPPDRVARVNKDGSQTFETPITFDLDDAFCWGITKNVKYGKYDIPLVLDLEDPQTKLLKDVALRNGVDFTLYGKGENTLYLRCSTLTDEQRAEMVGEGKMTIGVEFSVIGTYAKKNGLGRALSLRVDAIAKLGEAKSIPIPAPKVYKRKQ